MRIVTRRLLTVCGVLLVASAALAGCAPEPGPAPRPSPSAATDAPVFASDEEALAAATEAYAAYLAASDASWTGGDSARQVFLAMSIGQAHEGDLAAEKTFDERGWQKVGTTSFDSMRLQSSESKFDALWEVRTYLCVDVSASDVVDEAGRSVATPNRQLRLPLEVAFVSAASLTQQLLISESTVWSGSNFC